MALVVAMKPVSPSVDNGTSALMVAIKLVFWTTNPEGMTHSILCSECEIVLESVQGRTAAEACLRDGS